MKDLEDNVNHHVDQIIETETGLGTILETVLGIQTRGRRAMRRFNGKKRSRNKSRKN